MKGHFVNISKNIQTNKLQVTLEFNEDDQNLVDLFLNNGNDELDIKITKQKKIRSNDANAYFHKLVSDLADVHRISKQRCKNILLGRYGQRELDEDGNPVIISVLSSINMEEREDIHTVPTGYEQRDGKEYTKYAVVRGSHTYDTKEMSILLDGAISEAKDSGLTVLPTEEYKKKK